MQISHQPWRPVTDKIWVSVAQPASVNIGLVAGDDHVMMIDTGSTPEQGRQLAASAAELLGREVDRVVVTHAHYDHFFGLAGVAGAQSFGHEALIEALSSDDTARGCENLGISPDHLVAPSDPFSLVHALDLGNLRVEFLHFGPAHTQADVLVHVPSEGVWFTGDLVETDGDIQVGTDSSVQSWPIALDGILGAADNSTIYVPGHGPVTNRIGVYEQRTNIGILYGSAEGLVRRGVKLETALAALDNPGTPEAPHPGASEWDWPFSTDTVRQALPKLYDELAAKGQVPRTQLPISGI